MLASEHHLAVVTTNQATAVIAKDDATQPSGSAPLSKAALGLAWACRPTVRVMLTRADATGGGDAAAGAVAGDLVRAASEGTEAPEGCGVPWHPETDGKETSELLRAAERALHCGTGEVIPGGRTGALHVGADAATGSTAPTDPSRSASEFHAVSPSASSVNAMPVALRVPWCIGDPCLGPAGGLPWVREGRARDGDSDDDRDALHGGARDIEGWLHVPAWGMRPQECALGRSDGPMRVLRLLQHPACSQRACRLIVEAGGVTGEGCVRL